MRTSTIMNERGSDQWDWPLIRKRCKAEALRVVRRHHDAEEVVQEALARAWRSRGSCRTPEAPMPWCLQITRNEALRLLGRRRTAGSADALEDDIELEDQRAHGESDRAALRVDLDRALRTLTPHERLLIALRYEYDCSHPEIAAKLRIPEATARVHLHRAQKRLKPLL
jgi:RNA polymerase sigma-70 factor (ECF subfamily)